MIPINPWAALVLLGIVTVLIVVYGNDDHDDWGGGAT